MSDSTFTIQQNTVNGLVSTLNSKASVDLSNSPYTTNRILEIPQDIKLELNNGTLTLKAGSKVYVPNGFETDGTTPKFDIVTIESDLQSTRNNDLQEIYFIGTNFEFYQIPMQYCYSGSTTPSSFFGGLYAWWYDTTSNILKNTSDGGTTWVNNWSLPVCLATSSTAQITSIDQVFNGFGYIGSTVFALPGVQVQTPNGKNEDGTYKSVIRIIDSVKTYNANAWGTRNLNIIFDGSVSDLSFRGQPIERFTYNKRFSSDTATYSYDENTGIWWYSSNQSSWVAFSGNIVGSCRVESGKITQFQVDTVDSVANSNASNFSQAGRSYLSGLGMPSNRYIDLTLGASGSTYTAPANGWLLLRKRANGVGQYVYMFTIGSFIGTCFNVANAGDVPSYFLPVKTGDIVQVDYNLAGETMQFRFIYAEGEN